MYYRRNMLLIWILVLIIELCAGFLNLIRDRCFILSDLLVAVGSIADYRRVAKRRQLKRVERNHSDPG